jgi:hypothetical protein
MLLQPTTVLPQPRRDVEDGGRARSWHRCILHNQARDSVLETAAVLR